MLKGRSHRRWDDVEERLLAEAIKMNGTKNWDKIGYEMQTDRTMKQLQDHWLERGKECQELLANLGAAPRPMPSQAPGAGLLAGGAAGRLGAESLRIPTIRYRHHPYLRDASLRARCEKADVSRVRDLMDRYLTHVHWLEEALLPPTEAEQPSTANGGHASGASGSGNAAAASGREAEVAACLEVVAAAESLGVWTDPAAPVGAAAFVSEEHIKEMLDSVRGLGSNGSNAHSNGSNAQPFSRPGHAREVTDPAEIAGVAAEIRSGAFDGTAWLDLPAA
mmetsp:Transcript_20271/g.48994  ORF Transcript_20271/g.48994 Transcript_20271/m.48994 type:complete len:278 (-) Transcript_20271:61-894(-)